MHETNILVQSKETLDGLGWKNTGMSWGRSFLDQTKHTEKSLLMSAVSFRVIYKTWWSQSHKILCRTLKPPFMESSALPYAETHCEVGALECGCYVHKNALQRITIAFASKDHPALMNCCYYCSCPRFPPSIHSSICQSPTLFRTIKINQTCPT